jgi:hypothetical protein
MCVWVYLSNELHGVTFRKIISLIRPSQFWTLEDGKRPFEITTTRCVITRKWAVLFSNKRSLNPPGIQSQTPSPQNWKRSCLCSGRPIEASRYGVNLSCSKRSAGMSLIRDVGESDHQPISPQNWKRPWLCSGRPLEASRNGVKLPCSKRSAGNC